MSRNDISGGKPQRRRKRTDGPPGSSRPREEGLEAFALTTRSLGEGLVLAREVQRGFPVGTVDDLLESEVIARDDVYRLVIPQRTLSHRKTKGQSLTPEESNRLARVATIVHRALALFDGPEVAASWLRRPNRALGGERPLDLLASDPGARAVEQVLGRIEHGVYS